ncbi:MAG: FAD-dependent oxidoreductase [Candidatus Eremiobacteraeota bacterium]|nr:FAD-dependent oxidoreductase [Candidatus Eremiobacteraeota bacterium]
MEPISRRRFLLSALSLAAFVALDTLPAGPLTPALAAVGKEEGSPLSGDAHFIEMHTELLGRKRDGRARSYPSTPVGEKIDILIVGGGVAGLDTAYYLLTNPRIREKGATVRVFEMDDEPGGTSKEYEWSGIPYTNSAAYFYVPEPGTPDRKLYSEIGVLDAMVLPSSADKDSVIIGSKGFPDLFVKGRGKGFEGEKAAFEKALSFFRHIEENTYPGVPFEPGGPYGKADFTALDRLSMGELIEKGGTIKAGKKVVKVPAPFPPLLCEYIENYCYSSFGCSSYHVSAWQALNWFAAEFSEGGVGVLPGGNGRISTMLARKIESLDAGCLKCGHPVVDVAFDEKSRTSAVTVAFREKEGSSSYRTYQARFVVMACPLTVTRRILNTELPESVRQGLGELAYSGYVVANALINSRVFTSYWDTYCLNDYGTIGKAGESFYRQKPFQDLVNATWALEKTLERQGKPSRQDKTVITIYSPHPFDGQRKLLLSDDYMHNLRVRIKDDLLSRLAPQGLKEQAIEKITLARWGHAMLQARPGLLSGGLIDRLQESVASKGIFFAGTEIMGAPTIENCHITARAAAASAVSALSGRAKAFAANDREEWARL